LPRFFFVFLFLKNTQTKQKRKKEKEINRVRFSTVHGRVFVFFLFSWLKKKKTSFPEGNVIKKRIIRKSGHAPKNPHTRDASSTSSRLNRAPFSFSSFSTPAASCYPVAVGSDGGWGQAGGGGGLEMKKRVVGKKYTLILPQAIGFIVREKEHGVQG
jgi:hypothetical protein